MKIFSGEYLLIAKSLHLIFVVAWFAGLFYLPRLFIYQVEASKKGEEHKQILVPQLKIMQSRLLYIITWPAAILTAIFAIWLLIIFPPYLQMPWLHVKLGFVLLLYGYQFYCQRIFNQLQKDVYKFSSTRLRFFNEVATILLFAIVFTVVLKNTTGWLLGVGGIITLGIVLSVAIMFYRRARKKKGEEVD